jgi:1-acyl-sn-glycerol-3-phosphate acyltransferase
MFAHAAVAALILRLAYPRITHARRRALMQWWSAKLLRIVGLRVLIAGEAPTASLGATMVAANHVSWLDIFLVSSARPTRFVAKSEIRDWPLAGWIADKAGTLFVRRSEWRETARVNERVHDAFGQGDCVGLFPEGITTEGDTLLKFHSALFEPAVANEARVYPAAIRYETASGELCREVSFAGDRSFMESLALVIRQRRVVAKIAFAAPIEARGATRREVAVLARSRVASLLGLEASDTPPGKAAGR